MSEMPKILSSRMVVRFQDCDPFRHLNNARYINYFINAREDQVKNAYGLDIYQLGLTQGINWVVGYNKIAYFKTAGVMEEVEIETQVIFVSDKDMVVEMRMFNLDRSHIKALHWINFIHIDMKTQRLITHNEELMELLNQVVLPLEHMDFDKRQLEWMAYNQKNKHPESSGVN